MPPSIAVLLKVLVTVSHMTGAELDPEQMMCLSENIYHEARGEPIRGQIAVAEVTLNRVSDPRWPSTICEVVHDPDQFSWVEDRPRVKNLEAFKIAAEIAALAYLGKLNKQVGDANHYYNPHKSSPGWAKRTEYLGTLGNHDFHRG